MAAAAHNLMNLMNAVRNVTEVVISKELYVKLCKRSTLKKYINLHVEVLHRTRCIFNKSMFRYLFIENETKKLQLLYL